MASQFTNLNNPKAHYHTTGPEIFNDTDGSVDVFIAGIGTGGTISGVGKYLKENKKSVTGIGVEPYNSPLITKGTARPHNLQGIGANFIPETLDLSVVDKVMTSLEANAYKMGRLLAQKEGILVGISSGAVLDVAVEFAKQKEAENKVIVVLLSDTGERYLSCNDYF